ncbi:hypothetical protein [Wolbachia endosymbiont of Atemnus politus]|uniref:hypothetical protein n=1 Tax=Wolbachia endosymbiont of Atemnus politus TaxID=2682840 RepID=UPI001572060E|nr:hypothetical protein [Wolbachia endosymbiont of Atemnus politus]
MGVMGVVGIIGFIAYRCIKKYHSYYNAAPVLKLTDLESSSNNCEELLVSNSRTNSPKIVLNRVLVESGSSRTSSPSPESIRSSESRSGLSWNSNDVPEYHL